MVVSLPHALVLLLVCFQLILDLMQELTYLFGEITVIVHRYKETPGWTEKDGSCGQCAKVITYYHIITDLGSVSRTGKKSSQRQIHCHRNDS